MSHRKTVRIRFFDRIVRARIKKETATHYMLCARLGKGVKETTWTISKKHPQIVKGK